MSKLVDRVEERKAILGLSDVEIAQRMGLSQSYWAQIRSGRRRVTVRVVRGIIRAFPELAMDAWDWIRLTEEIVA